MTQGGSDSAARLRGAGLKVTGPRLAILALLEQDPHHPSAEELHRALRGGHPSLSLSTVYMTLAAFVRSGLVRRMPETDGRMRVDGFDQPHDHAICRICGNIFDIPPLPPPELPSLLPSDLELLCLRIEYDVLCTACRREARSAET